MTFNFQKGTRYDENDKKFHVYDITNNDTRHTVLFNCEMITEEENPNVNNELNMIKFAPEMYKLLERIIKLKRSNFNLNDFLDLYTDLYNDIQYFLKIH
jgi:hypothetical protein